MIEHATEWLGYHVELYDPEKAAPDYAHTVYRIGMEYDDEESLAERFARFLEGPGSTETPALIFGLFGEHDSTPQPIIDALVANRERLPKLRGIFLGDIISEECEMSWIQQWDVSPLFSAFPELEHFRVRGGTGLSLGRIRHEALRSLVVETGGLPTGIVADIAASFLPELEHLELWLGSSGYGWDGTLEDVRPLYQWELFPKLKYLGLRNCEIVNELAADLAGSPVLPKLEVLDLSLGTLGDEGAQVLLDNPALRSLRKLDLHHHYLTEGMMQKLRESGLKVDLRDPQSADGDGGEEDRYVAVSE